MITITKEQAKDLRNAFQCWQQDYDPVEDKEQYDMFGLGMVAMDALLASLEPVSVFKIDHESSLIKHVKKVVSETNAPPAPVSLLDERYQHLSELYHAQEKRLFKIAQRIKGPSFDKYAYSPSQAMDVLESAIFGESKDACRAAMLQSFGNSEQLDSPVIPDGWKLVPIELTGDMTNAMSEAILDDLHNVDVWRSVLAVAPQQEVK
ncbi:hypothetical protein Q7485_23360 [Enterobacter cloacae]|uniref:hypothetical protein n=1 Tax=Enterobacter TaxID=547 RepID=UPI00073C64D5|nr:MULTISPECIES: hypothetical protein [Enterobacter]EKV7706839.1 hypothetical protein [Enterobacter cloacae]KSY74163.1 hypothetical protein APU11_04740 [Enterobacter sp. 50793107]MDO9654452.1 hypothetical protein [Enterobacter cloacae]